MFKPKNLPVSIPAVPDTAYALVTKHLRTIAPMCNPHGSWNDVQDYCASFHGMSVDRHRNIYRISPDESLAVVGHTDSVAQTSINGKAMAGKPSEPIVEVGGIMYSVRKKRPIGGDDKVGVAIALAIGELLPNVSVILPADEEVGCVGSSAIDIPYHDLMIQCDRRGSSDLVTTAYGSEIASDECALIAAFLLPHRKLVDGMLTDVLTLSERGLCGNAFNMSCGYYGPHTCEEFIVLSQVWQTFSDTWTLLHGINAADMECAQPYAWNDPLSNYREPLGSSKWGGWDTDDRTLLDNWYKEQGSESVIEDLEEDVNS